MNLRTDIFVGKELRELTKEVKYDNKRDCYKKIIKFLNGDYYTHICSLYGLYGTGKTTLLLQTIADMQEEDFEKTAYIKLSTAEEVDDVTHDLDILKDLGYKYIFLEDATKIRDFVDCASMFSDIYSMMGMKIVVTGDESASIWIASCEELYDRVFMLHTTNIPYEEYCRILNENDIDKFLKSYGTLYENIDIERYINEAVCENIIFSLSNSSNRYRDNNCLLEHYSDGDLRKIIRGVIDDVTLDYVKETAKEIGIEINREHSQNNIKDMDIRRILRILKNINFTSDCYAYLTPYYFDKQKKITVLQPGIRLYLAEKLIQSLDESGSINGDAQKLLEKIKDDIVGEILPDNAPQESGNIIQSM